MPRIVAALLLGSLLGACAYSYNVGVKAVDGSTVALMPGQSATLADGLLRYGRLSSDSRCQPGAPESCSQIEPIWKRDEPPSPILVVGHRERRHSRRSLHRTGIGALWPIGGRAHNSMLPYSPR